MIIINKKQVKEVRDLIDDIKDISKFSNSHFELNINIVNTKDMYENFMIRKSRIYHHKRETISYGVDQQKEITMSFNTYINLYDNYIELNIDNARYSLIRAQCSSDVQSMGLIYEYCANLLKNLLNQLLKEKLLSS